MKKKLLITALCLCAAALLIPLLAGAGEAPTEGTQAAETAALSSQTLMVDGEERDCEKYNIGGNNYFRLRDMAYILNGSDAQFDVKWNAGERTVEIERGRAYTPLGDELEAAAGRDGGAEIKAERSSQRILIDGVETDGISVYNIGGSNYFKLRDLGGYMGFSVNYDAERRRIMIQMGLNPDEYMGEDFGAFGNALIEYMNENGYAERSYMVSPTSFRAALALAALGAEGATRDGLIKAMGFESMDGVKEWYGKLLAATDRFAEELESEKELYRGYGDGDEAAGGDGAFSIANSIWNNSDKRGAFRQEYVDAAESAFRAEAAAVPSDKITDEVNAWADRETKGMIKEISQDLSEVDAVLANALYLRTAWEKSFNAGATEKGIFRALGGGESEKEFMNKESKYLFYEDEGGKLLVIPMRGGINAAFVLGDIGNFGEKLAKATYEEVIVKLPKIDMETSVDSILTDYLRAKGAAASLDPGSADFSAMCAGAAWYIDTILQKSRIKMDEDGIEAAAVTAIMMETTAAPGFEEEPKEFIADEPFSFYLYTPFERGGNELLFYGRCVD